MLAAQLEVCGHAQVCKRFMKRGVFLVILSLFLPSSSVHSLFLSVFLYFFVSTVLYFFPISFPFQSVLLPSSVSLYRSTFFLSIFLPSSVAIPLFVFIFRSSVSLFLTFIPSFFPSFPTLHFTLSLSLSFVMSSFLCFALRPVIPDSPSFICCTRESRVKICLYETMTDRPFPSKE